MRRTNGLASFCVLAGLLFLAACTGNLGHMTPAPEKNMTSEPNATEKTTGSSATDETTETGPAEKSTDNATEVATFGAGCFWCVEAVLEQLGGVLDVTSGYMGGAIQKPTYEQVCSGTTGHAEVVQVRFDRERISYDKLLDYFWKLHDPTTLNRQGNDVGTQYRSAIFYHSEAQREAAEKSKKAVEASGAFADPIVTEIAPAAPLFKAEGYHQDYYRLNKEASYCRFVIVPKLDKLGLKK